jgi:hypothetical protein
MPGIWLKLLHPSHILAKTLDFTPRLCKNDLFYDFEMFKFMTLMIFIPFETFKNLSRTSKKIFTSFSFFPCLFTLFSKVVFYDFATISLAE